MKSRSRLTKKEMHLEIKTISILLLLALLVVSANHVIESRKESSLEDIVKNYSPSASYKTYKLNNKGNGKDSFLSWYLSIIKQADTPLPQYGEITFDAGDISPPVPLIKGTERLRGFTTIIRYPYEQSGIKKPILFGYHFNRATTSKDPRDFRTNAEVLYAIIDEKGGELIEIQRPFDRERTKTNNDRVKLIKAISRFMEE